MKRFEDKLSTLHRRTLKAELRVVRKVARQPDPAAALLKAIDAWGQEAHRWTTSIETLQATLQGASPTQEKALLAAWIRRHSPLSRKVGDLLALSRNFGLDAIRERATAHRDVLGTQTELALVALAVALEDDVDRRAAAGARLRRVIRAHERPQTRRRAAGCLVDLVRLEPDAPWAPSARKELVQLTREAPDVWLRRQAVPVLALLPAAERVELVADLEKDTSNDGALVRARAVEALVATGSWEVLGRWGDDAAEIVRFAVVKAAVEADRPHLWKPLRAHADPRTRARLADALGRHPSADRSLAHLAGDADPLVRRFALESGTRRARQGPIAQELVDAAELSLRFVDLRVRREAERLLAWVAHHRSPAKALAEPLGHLREGQRRRVALPMGVQPVDLAIALRPYALGGFGFTLKPHRGAVTVVRGEVATVTGWRVWHELKHPRPAKRQGHTHAVGPALIGPLQVPPLGLAEQSATGVPGQRVQVDAGDWGPHIPALDDYRRALRWGTATVVSGSGIVEVERPERWVDRLRARWALLFRYDALHQERLAAVEQHQEERFLQRLEGLGFEHRAAVGGFLPYILGTTGNTLTHLAILLGAFWALLIGSNVWLRGRVALHRRKLGLVVGGWGTRGKSGTERIKAGMLSGAGIPYVSKTTGCEAMILHGPRGDRVRELFLFRPFDKATIWEQADVVRFAATSGSRAMIWECMALNPRYVDILQRGWMRDDLSTLTNAYPDHEDVMGPTGMDVAHVIGSFAPKGSPLFTTEENMLPVLIEEAERFGSLCTPLSTAEKELIPHELIVRFPYAEHPSNIALAARISTELGLPRVEAIGWMADHVIPDLGALMVYAPVDIDGREVVFVNGHSANDELSFTHSWRHTGFMDHRVADHPEQWLIGLVNNRADRVPRSRVFARMVVRVAGAHRFLVIGTNLSGFMTFVDEALDELVPGLRLEDPDQWLRWSEHLKIPDPRGWLFYILRARGIDPSDLFEAFEDLTPVASVTEGRRRAAELELPVVEAELPELLPWIREETAMWLVVRGARTDVERKALLRERLRSRIILLEDPTASGDQVASAAAGLAPVGVPVRMMGMQNIKGTGLDFVYQWARWRTLHTDLQALEAASLQEFTVKRLTSVFHCDATLKALEDLPGASGLRERVEARRAELMALRSARPSGNAIGRAVRRWAWRFVDPFDAVWRRRRARQVLADLAMERVGHDEAEQILAALTYRQKG